MIYLSGDPVKIGDVVRAQIARVEGDGNVVSLVGVVVGSARNGVDRLVLMWLAHEVQPQGQRLGRLVGAPGVEVSIDFTSGRLVCSWQVQAIARVCECELLQRADGSRASGPLGPPGPVAVSVTDDDGDPS